ncbi:hypothetical protein ACWGDE_07550 [Streptomyces sp. NPDC054956]
MAKRDKGKPEWKSFGKGHVKLKPRKAPKQDRTPADVLQAWSGEVTHEVICNRCDGGFDCVCREDISAVLADMGGPVVDADAVASGRARRSGITETTVRHECADQIALGEDVPVVESAPEPTQGDPLLTTYPPLVGPLPLSPEQEITVLEPGYERVIQWGQEWRMHSNAKGRVVEVHPVDQEMKFRHACDITRSHALETVIRCGSFASMSFCESRDENLELVGLWDETKTRCEMCESGWAWGRGESQKLKVRVAERFDVAVCAGNFHGGLLNLVPKEYTDDFKTVDQEKQARADYAAWVGGTGEKPPTAAERRALAESKRGTTTREIDGHTFTAKWEKHQFVIRYFKHALQVGATLEDAFGRLETGLREHPEDYAAEMAEHGPKRAKKSTSTGESSVMGRGSKAPRKVSAVKVGDIEFSSKNTFPCIAKIMGHSYVLRKLAGTFSAQHEHSDGARLIFEGEDPKNRCRTGGDSFPNLPAVKRAILADAVARGEAVEEQQVEPPAKGQPEPVEAAPSSLPRPLRLALEREAAEEQAEPASVLPKGVRVEERADGWAITCKHHHSPLVTITSGLRDREAAVDYAWSHVEGAPRQHKEVGERPMSPVVAEAVRVIEARRPERKAVSWEAMRQEGGDANKVHGVIVTGANEGGDCDLCGRGFGFLVEVECEGAPYQADRWCLGRYTDVVEQDGRDFEALACEYEGREWKEFVNAGGEVRRAQRAWERLERLTYIAWWLEHFEAEGMGGELRDGEHLGHVVDANGSYASDVTLAYGHTYQAKDRTAKGAPVWNVIHLATGEKVIRSGDRAAVLAALRADQERRILAEVAEHQAADAEEIGEKILQVPAGESGPDSALADTAEIPVKAQPTPGLYAPVLQVEERQGEDADACRKGGHRYVWLCVEAEGVARILRSYLTCACTGEKLGNFGRSGPSMNQGTQRKPLGIRDASKASALGVASRNSYTTKGPWVVVSDTMKRCPVEWDHAKPVAVAADPARRVTVSERLRAELEAQPKATPGHMAALLEKHVGPDWRPLEATADPVFDEVEEEPQAVVQGLAPLTRQQRAAAWRLAAGEPSPAVTVTRLDACDISVSLNRGAGFVSLVEQPAVVAAPVLAELTVGEPLPTPHRTIPGVYENGESVLVDGERPATVSSSDFGFVRVRYDDAPELTHRMDRARLVRVTGDGRTPIALPYQQPARVFVMEPAPRDWFAAKVTPAPLVEEEGPDYAAISAANRAAAVVADVEEHQEHQVDQDAPGLTWAEVSAGLDELWALLDAEREVLGAAAPSVRTFEEVMAEIRLERAEVAGPEVVPVPIRTGVPVRLRRDLMSLAASTALVTMLGASVAEVVAPRV